MNPEQNLQFLLAAQRMLHIKRSQVNVLDFIRLMMPDTEDPDDVTKSRFEIAPHHRLLAEALQKVADGSLKRLCISLAPRHGKLVAHSTPILTTSGWKTHGALCVGDFVFHPSGKPVQVVALSPEGEASVEVMTTTGEAIKVHPNHEWTVLPAGHKSFKTLETKAIASRRLSKGVKGKRGFGWAHRLPTQYPLHFPPQPRPSLEPYVLGAWLGDGSSTKPAITHAPSDRAPISAIESLGYRKTTVCEHSETKVLTTYFSGPKPHNSGRLWIELLEHNLVRNKHIPSVFLTASIHDRLELLAGLIDTDGYVNTKTSRVVFSNCNRQLIDNVIELVRGLGMYPELQEVAPTLSSSGIQGKQTVYRVVFQPTLQIPTRLPRKRICRTVKRSSEALESVTPCAPEPGRCIQVDSPDGLYLVGGTLIPTHNSEMFSRMFPAWFLGKDPRAQIIIAGASTDFAVSEFGRKIKQIMSSPMYAQVFPNASLDGGSASVENLVTTEGGNIKSIGKGAQIIGRGANLLICDDLVAGIDEANSPTERQKLWDWFTTDAMSRLMPGGRVVVIHQRWHNSDLIGRLVDPDCPEYDPRVAKLWTHIKLPAVIDSPKIAEALGIELKAQTDPDIVDQFGEKPIAALWQDRYPLAFLAEMKRPNARRFEALYQGRPRLDEGNFFKLEWLRPYRPEDLPKNLRKYLAVDFAISTKQTADKTCIVAAGVDDQGIVWVLPNIFWERSNADGIVSGLLSAMKQHKPLMVWAEKGHISQSLGPVIRKRMIEENTFCAIIDRTPVRDKLTRAQAFNALCAMGRVRFPVFAHWWRDAESELLRFPEGAHDDFVDSVSWLGSGLQQLVPATQLKPAQHHGSPKTGTLAWVKQSSASEERRKRSAFSQGF